MLMQRSGTEQVLAVTGYPLHADAFRAYLAGAYRVETVQPACWQNSIADQPIPPAALIMDDSFPHPPVGVAHYVRTKLPGCGLIYVDSTLNIFKILHGFEQGFTAYLFLGDPLAANLRRVVEMARRGERFLSPTMAGLYERYTLYRGLFTELPTALGDTLQLMGEGLTLQQMVSRTGLRPQTIYRRQFRLRRHFGVATNAELLDLMQGMFEGEI